MKMFRSRGDSLRVGLSFFLITGALLGSIFCNAMSAEMKQDLHVLEQNIISSVTVSDAAFGELFVRVLPKRLGILGLFCLMSTSPSAPLLFMLAAGLFGFSVAILICPLTMASGIWGLWRFFLFVFPQWLLYLAVVYVLIWWMPVEGKRLNAVSTLFLAAMTILGAAAECFLNPWVLILL